MIGWIKKLFRKTVPTKYFIRFGTDFTTITTENHEILLKKASEITINGQNIYPINRDEIVMCDEAMLMFKRYNHELKKMSYNLKGSAIYVSVPALSAEVEVRAFAYALKVAKPYSVLYVCELFSAFAYLKQNTDIESMLIIDINSDTVKISIVNQYEIIYHKELGLRDREEYDSIRKEFHKREYESSISRANKEILCKGYTYQKAFIIGSSEILVKKYKDWIINILQIEIEIPKDFTNAIAFGIGVVYKDRPDLFRRINLN